MFGYDCSTEHEMKRSKQIFADFMCINSDFCLDICVGKHTAFTSADEKQDIFFLFFGFSTMLATLESFFIGALEDIKVGCPS